MWVDIVVSSTHNSLNTSVNVQSTEPESAIVPEVASPFILACLEKYFGRAAAEKYKRAFGESTQLLDPFLRVYDIFVSVVRGTRLLCS